MAVPRGVYQRMSDQELKKLRSTKVLILNRIETREGYFGRQDVQRIKDQIQAIDAERACRLLQIKLI